MNRRPRVVILLFVLMSFARGHVPLTRKTGDVKTGYFPQIHGPEPDEADAQHEMIPRLSRKHMDNHFVAVYIAPEGGHNATSVATDNGFVYHKPILSRDSGIHLIRRDGSKRTSSHGLEEDDRVGWWESQEPKMRVKRTGLTFDDPLYNEQWHLNSREDRGHSRTAGAPHNIHTIGAWSRGITGRGIVIGVVDDGLERAHPDLSGSYRRDLSHDFNDDDDDPTPSRRDYHGTACAGVAGADKDSSCGVGVAYGAGLAGLRLLGSWATDSEEAQALSWKCSSDVYIYTNSWGPQDDGVRLDGPGRITRLAIEDCILNGRDGLGSIYVWAGGNGRNRLDNSNNDGYANSPYTIAVAATDDYGKFSWYSEPGANIVCTAPSSGDSSREIVTTDLRGSHGANMHGDCTSSFGGTSATSPQVAGVAALMLQANRRLGWRDVQHILAATSRALDPQQGRWFTNEAGFAHSYSYGFGMVDASAAVQAAIGWTPVTPQPSFSTPDLPGATVNFQTAAEVHWDASAYDRLFNSFAIEHVQVHVEAETPRGHGYMGIQLCAPSHTCSVLAEGRSPGRDPSMKWTFMSVRNWGERVSYPDDRGPNFPNRWTLRVGNFFPQRSNPLVLSKWRITFHGSTPNENNVET